MMHNNTAAVMFAKSLCVTLSLTGTDDDVVVARYTCFIFFSLFAKQLIPQLLLCFSCLIALAGFLKLCLMVDVTDLAKKKWSEWDLSSS